MAILPREVADSLTRLLDELTLGAGEMAFVLNPGDAGLLASLEKLSAREASMVPEGGQSSVASHTDHVRYGFWLMNRWGSGEENPFADADWGASWQRTSVTEEEWRELLRDLRAQVAQLRETIGTPRELQPVEMSGLLASVVHLAYHVGAIRQLQPDTRGPRASD